jgi:hypothetical protein
LKPPGTSPAPARRQPGLVNQWEANMAKPPPVERFRITGETDVTSLGPVMSVLAKIPGFTVTGSELVTTVRRFATNVTTPGFSTQAWVTEWIKDHPTFKAIEVVTALKETGNGDGKAVYPALTYLVKAGVLKKLGEGMYSRVDVKAISAPKKKAKQKQEHRDVSHLDFILRAASRNHGKFNTSWMKKQFEKDGRVPGNVSPTVTKLVQRKAIKRVGDSLYELTPKKTDKPSVNGAAPVEVSANG